MTISNCRLCSETEKEKLKLYLYDTPVCWLVRYIENGAEILKGELESTETLGQIRTIWSTLGHINKSPDKFLVREVLTTLHKYDCGDIKTLQLIQEYKSLIAENKLEIIITLLKQNDDIIICDGNKRAVAYYEYLIEKERNKMTLPVYIVNNSI
jgi:hypothetical protein